MPTNCSAAKQLPQFYKHSKSADLLRKSLLFHVWRVPSSKALSCKHEQLFELETLVSSYYILYSINLRFYHQSERFTQNHLPIYSNSTITNQFCLDIICCRVRFSFDFLIYPYYPAYTS